MFCYSSISSPAVWVGLGLLWWAAGCAGPQDEPNELAGDRAVQYQGVSDRLPPGRCMDQDDCEVGSHCVATAPGINECVAGDHPEASSRRAPNGRPAPPAFLLDGRMLRRHARGGSR